MKGLNIVLVEPEIPPNTGNIARLCGATGSTLHLVHPLGFRTDDRALKRAGLDYWHLVDVVHHENLDSFLKTIEDKGLLRLFSTKGKKPYTRAEYPPGSYLLFGKETQGLPAWLMEKYKSQTFFIPMWGATRSLNLSTSVGIVTYHAYLQLFGTFDDMQPKE